MVYDSDSIRSVLEPLLLYLKALPQPDRAAGSHAAEVFESKIEALRDQASDPGLVMENIIYGMSGKGITDWKWSPQVRSQLDTLISDAIKSLREIKPERPPTTKEIALVDEMRRRVSKARAKRDAE